MFCPTLGMDPPGMTTVQELAQRLASGQEAPASAVPNCQLVPFQCLFAVTSTSRYLICVTPELRS